MIITPRTKAEIEKGLEELGFKKGSKKIKKETETIYQYDHMRAKEEEEKRKRLV